MSGWRREAGLLSDAMTSGGLLVAVPRDRAEAARACGSAG